MVMMNGGFYVFVYTLPNRFQEEFLNLYKLFEMFNKKRLKIKNRVDLKYLSKKTK